MYRYIYDCTLAFFIAALSSIGSEASVATILMSGPDATFLYSECFSKLYPAIRRTYSDQVQVSFFLQTTSGLCQKFQDGTSRNPKRQ